jgi:CRP-like cAMP-binding protein
MGLAGEERPVVAGGFVFQQGDPARHIYQVQRGRIRLVRYTGDGQCCTLFFAGAGQLFAEAALFAEHYHCAALADTDSVVVTYAKEQLLAGLLEHPESALGYIALLSRQVRELRTLLELRTIQSARDRVLQYLLLHADSAAGNSVPIPFSLKNIAQALGLAHETLYRTLSALEEEGRISRGPASIILKKPSV